MQCIAGAVFGKNRKISQRGGKGLPMLVTIATIRDTTTIIFTLTTNITIVAINLKSFGINRAIQRKPHLPLKLPLSPPLPRSSSNLNNK